MVSKVIRFFDKEQYNSMSTDHETYNIFVIVNSSTDRIVGSATLIMEKKFIHNCSVAGHIEDVVVLDSERGKNLGKM